MSASRLFAAVFAAVGFAALTLQLAILHEIAAARGIDLATATVNFFSYFTILSNLLAASVLAAHAAAGEGSFLRRPAVATGVALYMAVTGAIYFAILRHVWAPQGLQWVADTVLHYVQPVAMVAFWVAVVPKRGFGLRHIAAWAVFPLLYGVYALARGAVMGFYPYPFLDAAALGYPAVFVNMALIAAAFVVLGAAVVALGRRGRA